MADNGSKQNPYSTNCKTERKTILLKKKFFIQKHAKN